MAKKYSIPKKWNEQERQAFIDLYESMIESPEFYLPNHMYSDGRPMVGGATSQDKAWKCLAWNAAWMSAEFLRYNRKFNS